MKSAEDGVKKIVAKIFEVDTKDITRDTRFVEDLLAKSLQIIEMIAMMEDEFNIEVDDSRARGNRTVGQAIDYVEELLKVKAL